MDVYFWVGKKRGLFRIAPLFTAVANITSALFGKEEKKKKRKTIKKQKIRY